MDNKIIKSFNVTREMIIDRQYKIIEENNTDTNYIIGENQKKHKIIAYFIIENSKKITPKTILDLINILTKTYNLDENSNFIFIISPKDNTTSDITTKLKQIENNKSEIRDFQTNFP